MSHQHQEHLICPSAAVMDLNILPAFHTPLSAPAFRQTFCVPSTISRQTHQVRRHYIRHTPARCSMKPFLEKLRLGQHLTLDEAKSAMDYLGSGNAHDAETGAFLGMLSAKGETPEEISGLVQSLHAKMIPVKIDFDVLDIVGTGGDGANTVNISTAACILAAAAGCKIAKHGNRSVSSKSGSADVLEALGVDLSISSEGVKRCIEEAGIGFMFAMNHHPSLKHIGPARKAMRMKTVFNIIGPLLNPSEAKYVLLGVSSPDLLDLMADAAIKSGVKKGVVVHTAGLDEYSNTGVSEVVEINGLEKRRTRFDPQIELGMARAQLSDLKGGDATENAAIIRSVLAGELNSPVTDAIALNAAVGCYVYGLDDSIPACYERIQGVLRSGKGLQTLNKWCEVSKESARMEKVSELQAGPVSSA